jgi:putative peptidoglycan lipid II flippase
VAVAGSWVLTMLAQVVLAELVPARQVVPALALGSTIGQTVAAIPLVIVTRRIRGKPAMHGVGRATLAGLAAAAAGTAAGLSLSAVLPASHKLLAAGVAVAAAGFAVIAFGVAAFLLDPHDLRALLARLRQVARLRPTRHAAS